MVSLPAEWQYNNGNSQGFNAINSMNGRARDATNGLIQVRRESPIITVEPLKPRLTRSLNKDFRDGIDYDFKIRNSQFPDVYFRNTSNLISVNDDTITGHYVPSFVYIDNDFHSNPRQVQPIITRNEFGFDRTATRDITYNRISPQEVMSSVSNNNSLRHISYEGNRHSAARTPIVQIKQNRDKINVIS